MKKASEKLTTIITALEAYEGLGYVMSAHDLEELMVMLIDMRAQIRALERVTENLSGLGQIAAPGTQFGLARHGRLSHCLRIMANVMRADLEAGEGFTISAEGLAHWVADLDISAARALSLELARDSLERKLEARPAPVSLTALMQAEASGKVRFFPVCKRPVPVHVPPTGGDAA